MIGPAESRALITYSGSSLEQPGSRQVPELSFPVVTAVSSAVCLDVLLVPAQVRFFPLQFFAILFELSLVSLNLGFAGVVGAVSFQLLLILLDNLFLLLDFLPVCLNILLVFLDVVLLIGVLASGTG